MWTALLTLDSNLLLWIQEFLRSSVLDPLMITYTKLGNLGLLWIVLAVFMLCFKKTRRAGLLGLCALALGAICTNGILKHLVDRTRPWLTVEGLTHLIIENDPRSFPSGHTCAAFAAAGVWLKTLPKRWMGLAALALAALMGFSRLYLGVHFPSDVLVGMLVGLLCAWAVLRIDKAVEVRIKN